MAYFFFSPSMRLLVAIAVVTLVTAVPNRKGDLIPRDDERFGEGDEEFTGTGSNTDGWGQGAGGDAPGVEEIGDGNNAGEIWMHGPPLYRFCKINKDDGSTQENKTCEMDAVCSASITLVVQGYVSVFNIYQQSYAYWYCHFEFKYCQFINSIDSQFHNVFVII